MLSPSKVTDKAIQEYIKARDEAVVVIGASWCGPCKALLRNLDNKGIDYLYVDVTTQTAPNYVREQIWWTGGVPTTIRYSNGEIVSRTKGAKC